MLAAAIRLFSAHGWAGTTIAGIAADAGVAVETIYSGFGSKKALLRAAMDVAVVGDAEPIPFADRPYTQRMAEGTFGERVDAAGARSPWTCTNDQRACGVPSSRRPRPIRRSTAGGTSSSAAGGSRSPAPCAVLGTDVDEITIDLAWAMVGPEVYLKVTTDLERSRKGYETFLREGFTRLIAPRLTCGKLRR